MKYIRNIIRQMETIALSMGRVRNVQLTARSEPQWSNLSADTKRIGCLNGPVTFNCKLSAKLLADYAQCAAGSERVSLDFMKKRRRRRRVRGCKDVDILAQPPSFITKIQTQRERHFPDSSSSHWSETSSDTAFNFLLFFFNFFFFFKKRRKFSCLVKPRSSAGPLTNAGERWWSLNLAPNSGRPLNVPFWSSADRTCFE